MRIAAIVCCAVFLAALAAPALAGAERLRGSLEVADSRGVIVVKGRGALLGRLDKGTLTITDLSPNDQWSPRVNGVPRGKIVTMRGHDVAFYVPAGRYRVVVKGEGINISARGAGNVVIDGQPDPTGAAGTYAVGDDDPQQVPDEPVRVPFGTGTVVSATTPRRLG